jgi:hypothetical protein
VRFAISSSVRSRDPQIAMEFERWKQRPGRDEQQYKEALKTDEPAA